MTIICLKISLFIRHLFDEYSIQTFWHSFHIHEYWEFLINGSNQKCLWNNFLESPPQSMKKYVSTHFDEFLRLIIWIKCMCICLIYNVLYLSYSWSFISIWFRLNSKLPIRCSCTWIEENRLLRDNIYWQIPKIRISNEYPKA